MTEPAQPLSRSMLRHLLGGTWKPGGTKEQRKMARVRAQLARFRRRGGWIPFDHALEDESERFISGRVDGPMRITGPTPDAAFWMAEPDADLPLDMDLAWETRHDD